MIRPAQPADVPEILEMVRELAEYEHELSQANATVEQLHQALFSPSPSAFAHVAIGGAKDGPGTGQGIVGFALWFLNFSTWTGTNGIYLEDLYVTPGARGGGHGKALLAELAAICVQRGYQRFEWSVLDWNTPAIGFYRSIGALGQDEWTVQRLSGDALAKLAAWTQ